MTHRRSPTHLALLAISVALTMGGAAPVWAQGAAVDLLRGLRAAGEAKALAHVGTAAGATAKAARVAEEVADAAKAGRLATVAASGSWRAAHGLSVAEAATAAFASYELLEKSDLGARVYLALEEGHAALVPARGTTVWTSKGTVAEGLSTDQLLHNLARKGAIPEGPVHLLAEREAFLQGDLATASLPPGSDVHLPGTDGPPLLARPVQLERGFERMVEIRPGLVVRVRDLEVLPTVRQLLALELDRGKVRVAAAFDRVADEPSVTALRGAVAQQVSFSVIQNEADLLAALSEAENKTLALVGHLELDARGAPSLVIRDKYSAPTLSIPLDRLSALAAERKVTLLPLGCETALHGTLAGYARNVWSADIANQLRAALAGRTWGDFMAALGTPDNPLVLTPRTVDGVLTLVATRAEPSALKAATRLAIPARLLRQASDAAARTEQLVPFLPTWWSWLVQAAAAILGLGFLGAIVRRSSRIFAGGVGLAMAVALLPLALPVLVFLYLTRGRRAKQAVVSSTPALGD